MLSLNTNAAALSTQTALANSQKALTASMTRLGTGYRVNSAMDDAAGLQIATRLNSQTRGMAVAQKNTQNGISMMQTAEGAFSEVTDILQRMKDLATEGANGTSSTDDKTAMQAEYDALGQELYNITANTSFGGSKLLDAASGSLAATTGVTFQIGASASETMKVDVSASLKTGGTLDAALKAVSTNNYKASGWTSGTEIGASATITLVETALKEVGTVRSALGAASNRLDHVYNNLGNMSTNTAAAKGRIMDVDYATETSNMTAKQMLLQAGTSMLKQSSSMSQMVLSLMQ
ncbi:flagellin [Ideonella oryzae]|uniref:Flagellin n=1 Tax=Ideonella oryzae TaxID=2937441 RepID=A0ABT1BNP5_9BURK|nr:flagellin [Ideonella oryzae]MCO5977052.1 Lateral flagellin [Ideonella oryzae]